VTDQALFAGANFLVSILLARWLEPAAYGAFSLAYALFLLLGTVHTGLWTEPMLVYGSGRFREDFAAYQQVLLRHHWRFGGAACLFFLVLHLGFWACGAREVALSFLGLSLATPTVLYLWIVRRGAYVLLKPRLAALGGGLYLLLYLGQTFLFFRTNTLNTFTALLAMAVAGLASAESIRWRMKTATERVVDAEEVHNLHWRYGRWALLAWLFYWLLGNISYLTLSIFHGLEATAHFKALMNLLMPILHFNGAISIFLVPEMVRVQTSGNLNRFTKFCLVALITSASGYWILLITSGQEFMRWLYNEKYADDYTLLIWLGLLPIFMTFTAVSAAKLRALNKTKILAQTYGLLAFFSAATGTILVFHYKIQGAILSLLLTNGILAILLTWKTKKII
jgi:O-antigen/teichoic acid export membrane protein